MSMTLTSLPVKVGLFFNYDFIWSNPINILRCLTGWFVRIDLFFVR